MLAFALAGCGGDGNPSLGRATATPTAKATASATPSPETVATPTPRPRRAGPPAPARFRRSAQKLGLPQRIAQLMVVGFPGVDLSSPVFGELAGHGWGGIIVGPDNAFDVTGVGLFAGEAQAVAANAGNVAPLVAAFDDGRPPKLGSSRATAKATARAAAAAAKAQGVTLTTAPSIDVGLGADAAQIARIAPGAVAGWVGGGIASAPSHFPGQGTVTQDPLDGPANVGGSARQLARRDLKPFRTALRHAPAVTVSSAAFLAYDPVTPAALTPGVVRGLLRSQLRFRGVALSDDITGLSVATGEPPQRVAVDAVRTGIDLLYVPDASQRNRVFQALLRAAKSKRLPRSRVLDAVARVLSMKHDLKQ